MIPTSGEPKESWTECPHCGARFRTWDRWYGSAVWMFDGSRLEPVMDFRFCPVCGGKLEGSGSDERKPE